ncbi:MAG: GC-type dockerin domain-anchored protein [Planctomycetota bacterium]
MPTTPATLNKSAHSAAVSSRAPLSSCLIAGAALALSAGSPAAAEDVLVGNIVWPALSTQVLDDDTRILGSLTIEEGVQVVFDGNFELRVDDGATLTVRGTPDFPVVFNNPGGIWDGLRLLPGSVGDIEHAIFTRFDAVAILVDDAGLTLSDSEIGDLAGATVSTGTRRGIRGLGDSTIHLVRTTIGPIRARDGTDGQQGNDNNSTASAQTSANTKGRPGPPGTDGFPGAAGFSVRAIEVEAGELVVLSSIIEDIAGGAGGDGGRGGNNGTGGAGGTGTVFSPTGAMGGDGVRGQDGGNGATGGQPIGVLSGADRTVIANSRFRRLFGGDGGMGGRGGRGGNGGRGGPGTAGFEGGNGGPGGRGGIGGIGGLGGFNGAAVAISLTDGATGRTADIISNTFADIRGGNGGKSGGSGPGGSGGAGGAGGPGLFANGNNGPAGPSGSPGAVRSDRALGETLGSVVSATADLPMVVSANNIYSFEARTPTPIALGAASGYTSSHDLIFNAETRAGFVATELLVADPVLDGVDVPGEGSPAIDSGDATFLPADELDLDNDGDTAEPLPLDALGNARVQGIAIDRGAIEAVPACAADLVAPVGVLDIFDIIEFLARFDASDPSTDLASPTGVFDVFDVIEYLALFDQGC